MKIIFEGDSGKFDFDVSYSDIQLDPGVESQLRNCEVVLYSKMDSSKVLGKYALRKQYSEGSGWGDLVIGEDNKIELVVTGDDTKSDIYNIVMMQITNYIPDNSIPVTALSVETGVTELFQIKKRVG